MSFYWSRQRLFILLSFYMEKITMYTVLDYWNYWLHSYLIITAQSVSQHFYPRNFKPNKKVFSLNINIEVSFPSWIYVCNVEKRAGILLVYFKLNFFSQFYILQTLQINGPEVERWPGSDGLDSYKILFLIYLLLILASVWRKL